MLTIKVADDASPFLQRVIQEKPRWFESALKSAGFWAKKEIQKGIRSRAPGGQAYTKGMSSARRRKLDAGAKDKFNNPFANTQRRPMKSYPPMGHLVNAVKYDKTRVSQGIVKVGWTSRSAVRVGTFQERGTIQTVTDKMRKLFFAAGIGISKNTISLPTRQTYKPMKPFIETGAREQVKLKILDYMAGVTGRSQARSRRVYRVYG